MTASLLVVFAYWVAAITALGLVGLVLAVIAALCTKVEPRERYYRVRIEPRPPPKRR